jgi:hypothetical protein
MQFHWLTHSLTHSIHCLRRIIEQTMTTKTVLFTWQPNTNCRQVRRKKDISTKDVNSNGQRGKLHRSTIQWQMLWIWIHKSQILSQLVLANLTKLFNKKNNDNALAESPADILRGGRSLVHIKAASKRNAPSHPKNFHHEKQIIMCWEVRTACQYPCSIAVPLFATKMDTSPRRFVTGTVWQVWGFGYGGPEHRVSGLLQQKGIQSWTSTRRDQHKNEMCTGRAYQTLD